MRSLIGWAALAAAAAGFAGTTAAQAQEMDLMQFADTSQDGKVSLEEYTAFSEQGWGFFSQGADKVKVASLEPMAKGAFNGIAPDANGDVTHAAYTASTPDRFKKFDTNGDGSLDKAELTAAIVPPTA
jgi:Ca2+-binding EF-hand superfamily protein